MTHLWNDQVLRKADEHQEHEYLRQCFYRGRVRGDEHSAVTVSLCGGMVRVSDNSIVKGPHKFYSNVALCH